MFAVRHGFVTNHYASVESEHEWRTEAGEMGAVMGMTADEIINAIMSDSRTYIHYTDGAGLQSIQNEGVIRANHKFALYLSQEPMSPSEADMKLFISATTHAGRGSHILLLRLDSGVRVVRTAEFEFRAETSIRLDQHMVLYAGPNPF